MGFTSVLALPMLVVVVAGIYYLYNEVLRFMSKSVVRNKVVVITDAVSGVGNECAKLFHKGGARLILCGKSWDKLESLSDDLSSASDPSVTFTPKLVLLDFSDMDSMPDVITEILECYGCVDVLICNSSLKIKAPVQTMSLELDKTIMDTNYFGPITLAKGVLQSMISRRTGHLLLVNSIQGKLAVPFRTAYAASKHAVQAFFDCLRAEVEEYGISVSTISHTFISALPKEGTPSSKPNNSLWSFLSRHLSHGVYPVDLADEILRTVSRRKKEVLLAHPIPRAALYIRSLFPSLFFAVVAAGVKDVAIAEPLQ
ncbi:dehydrogenase/reductase (SDR family) member 7Cb [Megalops cyprinoides]|uniref:dehydrogenase/reductase (SDR family) member 7Cb n=1 Tax=Megalops cyprinoides TaxID=118141 RepID=UPI0018656604|nr:dehydrogenase/reductase (SDR family) member 7Cb [Megalops cyprinoides]XP_036396857.1 dehydrogenase/reductase (SDR family) member 7Cb [Megalops cyprinoides]XP_036396866.1 dehydrogenase/reductase (SDR family) member 7Cb [Megalops cyprinoides]